MTHALRTEGRERERGREGEREEGRERDREKETEGVGVCKLAKTKRSRHSKSILGII